MIKIKAVVKHQDRDRSLICEMNCVLCRTPCVKRKKYAHREMPERAFALLPAAQPLPWPVHGPATEPEAPPPASDNQDTP